MLWVYHAPKIYLIKIDTFELRYIIMPRTYLHVVMSFQNSAVTLQVELSYTSTYINNISVTYYSAKTIKLQTHIIYIATK